MILNFNHFVLAVTVDGVVLLALRAKQGEDVLMAPASPQEVAFVTQAGEETIVTKVRSVDKNSNL